MANFREISRAIDSKFKAGPDLGSGLGLARDNLRIDPTRAKQLSMEDTAILPHAGGKYVAPGYLSPPRQSIQAPPVESKLPADSPFKPYISKAPPAPESLLPPAKWPEGTHPFGTLAPPPFKENLAPLVDASIGHHKLWRPAPVEPTAPAGNRIITPGGNKGYSVAVGDRRMQFFGDDAAAHAMAGRFKRVPAPAQTSGLNANAVANVGMGASGALAGTALGNAWLNRPGQQPMPENTAGRLPPVRYPSPYTSVSGLAPAVNPKYPAVQAPQPIPQQPHLSPALSSFWKGAKSLATPTLNQLGY